VTDDGRTIPRCGYRLEDFVDDDIGGETQSPDQNASRDGFCTTTVQQPFAEGYGTARWDAAPSEVREPAAVYRVTRLASVT
jgi:hypothetical protein